MGQEFSSQRTAPTLSTIQITKSSRSFSLEYGIKVLAEGDDPYFDILALHGLSGGRKRSWTHKESNILWLRDLLPKDIPQARIMTYGYDGGSCYLAESRRTIDDVAEILIAHLTVYRLESETENRPIVFVAHDLGGIILKSALVYSSSHNGSIARSTFGVMFFGTPHFSTKVLDSEIVSDIQSSYQPISQDFYHVFLYETFPVIENAELLVPRNSAVLVGQPKSIVYGICGDHHSMVKFGSHDDEDYIFVRQTLQAMAHKIADSQLHIMRPLSSSSQLVVGSNINYATDQAFLDAALLEKPFPKDSYQCLDGRIKKLGNYIVAAGGFSDIWLGKLGDTQVAIKVLRRFDGEGLEIPRDRMLRRLWREHLAWSSYRHPNILSCLGFSYDFDPATEFEIPALIAPWMKHGSLNSYINRYPDVDRIPMIKGLLSALIFLHSLSPPVVHGDIRAGNMLVSDEGVPLLTDFGLSRLMGVIGLTTSSNVAGSLRWMSPELLHNGRHSEKSDVWAFGMTIVEIFTGKPPYHELNNRETMMSINSGTIPTRPEFFVRPDLSDLLWDVCTQCWRMDPHKRPLLRQFHIADFM